jgi:hypothetical protein
MVWAAAVLTLQSVFTATRAGANKMVDPPPAPPCEGGEYIDLKNIYDG